MNNIHTVKVPGKPKGKARPRFAKGRAYTPKNTVEYEKLISQCYQEQNGTKHEGEISLDIKAVFMIPKSWTNRKKKTYVDEKRRPEIRPDIDNIAKVVMDALNGIAYEDDSQVVDMKVSKVYDIGSEGLLITIGGSE